MRVNCVWAAAVAATLWVAGCGSAAEEGRDRTAAAHPATAEQQAPAAAAAGGEVDATLAERGEQLLSARGCTACHTVGGGRLVGPDLAGVTERRGAEFILAMILNPDSMLANDATAKQLLGQYFTPMSNQGVTLGEARALLEYLRGTDAGGEEE